MWDNDVTGLSDGDFAYEIPQGNYKILAERFDGLYKSAFYDADSNGTADVVSITSNITGIDFVLESRPTATVTIKLLDANTSEPVKYAWFDFFDAEDEFAPIVFPHLGMIDFESPFLDGTYTLREFQGGRLQIGDRLRLSTRKCIKSLMNQEILRGRPGMGEWSHDYFNRWDHDRFGYR